MMKKAVKILIIITCIIGIIWSLIGIVGGILLGGFNAAFEDSQKSSEVKIEKYTNSVMKHIGSFFLICFGLIFGIVATAEKTKKILSIANSIFLLLCGIFATILLSYLCGPLYILCGLLIIINNLITKASTV